MAALSEPEHLRVTYNDVHNLIRESARKIEAFNPDIIIAIGLSPVLRIPRNRKFIARGG